MDVRGTAWCFRDSNFCADAQAALGSPTSTHNVIMTHSPSKLEATQTAINQVPSCMTELHAEGKEAANT